MKTLENKNNRRFANQAHWGWLLPILALSPLSMAAKGCSNSGVVGDDCPTTAECGAAGSGSQAGTGNTGAKTCGGLLGTGCDEDEFCAYAPDAKCGSGDQTGKCQSKPDACDDIYKAVCGCNGKTYGNECEANGDGQSVASEGECVSTQPGKTCGGLLGTECAQGEYCNYAPEAKCGDGDQTGACATIPEACDTVYAPVCGCDGKTYGNECDAAGKGVSVASSGECGGNTGTACGGKQGAMCADDQYCLYAPEADCGRFDAQGTCTDLPKGSACDAVYDPVCGCDGKTYGNDCQATLAGASIDHTGACGQDPNGKVCGGITGAQCDAGEFCNYALVDMCGAGDMQGSCEVVPDACTKEADPVCGCDGKPYANPCSANAAGTAVAKKGACAK